MGYEVLTRGGITIITDMISGLQVEVTEKLRKVLPVSEAYCMATVYQIKGGFIPEMVLLFEALNSTDLVNIKGAADHYCRVFLQTELYVKEVPPDSKLFEQEAARLYGEKDEANATVSVISNSRTK